MNRNSRKSEYFSTTRANTVIQTYYKRIHPRYDRVNSWISLGLDQYWRYRLVGFCRKTLPFGTVIVDLCTGTGKTAKGLLKQNVIKGFKVLGLDFSVEMIIQSDEFKRSGNKGENLVFAAADARFLPFRDQSVSAVTTTFATRNLDARPNDYQRVMEEIFRILPPGGLWCQLETAQPGSPVIRWLFHRFVDVWVGLIRRFLKQDKASYAFLTASIKTFDAPDGLRQRMENTGFETIKVQTFLFGSMMLLVAKKN